MRIGVSVSRTWRDYAAIHLQVVKAFADAPVPGPQITLVHGASGMDWFIAGIAYGLGMQIEEHPADWNANPKQAGMIRNQTMVDKGAGLWLAFADPCRRRSCRNPRLHPTHGTGECAKMAQRAGIPVRRFGGGWGDRAQSASGPAQAAR